MTRNRTAGAAGNLAALRMLMQRVGGRIPYAGDAAARRAALDQTEPGDRDGLELLLVQIPAGVAVQPDPDKPAGPGGPLSFYDWGDREECAEEYGIDRRYVKVVGTYKVGKRGHVSVWDLVAEVRDV